MEHTLRRVPTYLRPKIKNINMFKKINSLKQQFARAKIQYVFLIAVVFLACHSCNACHPCVVQSVGASTLNLPVAPIGGPIGLDFEDTEHMLAHSSYLREYMFE